MPDFVRSFSPCLRSFLLSTGCSPTRRGLDAVQVLSRPLPASFGSLKLPHPTHPVRTPGERLSDKLTPLRSFACLPLATRSSIRSGQKEQPCRKKFISPAR